MAIFCPKCKSELFEVQSQGSTLHFCGQCRGAWFDNNEFLYHLRAKSGSADLTWVDSASRVTNFSCPRCNSALKETPFKLSSLGGCSVSSFLMVDYCVACKGIWLDEGEIQKAEEVAKTLPELNPEKLHVLDKVREDYPIQKRKLQVPISIPLVAFGLFFSLLMVYSNALLTTDAGRPIPRASHHYCSSCNGSGKHRVACSVCQGLGKVSSTGPRNAVCPSCGGSGRCAEKAGRCPYCGGAGWIAGGDVNCENCRGTGKLPESTKRICATCNGTGHVLVRESCHICGGTGRSAINPSMGCPGCGGSGREEVSKTCSQCQAGVIETRYEKTCPVCNGRGRTGGERKNCDHCLGTGYLSAGSSGGICPRCSGSGAVVVADSTSVICASCRGTGVEKEVACESCGGTGESHGS